MYQPHKSSEYRRDTIELVRAVFQKNESPPRVLLAYSGGVCVASFTRRAIATRWRWAVLYSCDFREFLCVFGQPSEVSPNFPEGLCLQELRLIFIGIIFSELIAWIYFRFFHLYRTYATEFLIRCMDAVRSFYGREISLCLAGSDWYISRKRMSEAN